MYSRGVPASAPPKMYVNRSVNMIGVTVTSKSWKGTCLILSIARQARVPTVDSAGAGRGRGRMPRSWWVRSPEGSAWIVIVRPPGSRRPSGGR
jgi:hypothetical protein